MPAWPMLVENYLDDEPQIQPCCRRTMGSPVAITIVAQKKLSPEAINVKLWNIYNYLYLSAILGPTFQTLACNVLVKSIQLQGGAE